MSDAPVLHLDDRRVRVERPLVLGRHSSCDLQITQPGASREHARIEPRSDGLWVTDLDSANGTRVNDRRIREPTRLGNGDVVAIGKARLHVELPAAATASDVPAAAARPAAPKRRPSGEVPTRSAVRSDPANLVGAIVAGHRIGDLLGADELGATYRARQLSLSRDVAFTVITAELAEQDPARADRLLEHLRAAAALNDPHLVAIHECGRDGDLLWHSTGFVDGDTVARLLERDQRIDPALALLVCERAAKALSAAHAAGLHHGDIRPETVMVDRHGQVKVTNLGLAALHRAALGAARTSRSPAHTAPELAEGADPTPASDIYALGCLFVHMLTGSPPYTGRHAEAVFKAHRDRPLPVPSEELPGLPAEIDKLVAGMLAKQPQWRFTSVDELLPDLAAARERLTENPPPPSAAPPPRARRTPSDRHPVRRRGVGNALAPVVVAAVLIGGVIVAWPHLSSALQDAAPSEPAPQPARTATGPDESAPRTATPDDSTPSEETPRDPASTTAPAASDLTQAWTTVTAQVAALADQAEWRRAERELRRFIDRAQAAGNTGLAAAAEAERQQLLLDAGRWYTRATADLPSADDDPRALLVAVSALRSRAASGDRRDVTRRYREAAERMRRSLALARADMLRALESGEPERLPAIADAIAAQFVDTPLAGEHRRLHNLASTAAAVPFAESWLATRARLPSATGDARLPAAAALLLDGADAQALRLLLTDPGRLDAATDDLLAKVGLTLDFADPAATDHLAVVSGSVETRDGALTGPAGAPMSIRLPGPATADLWSIQLDLTLEPSDDVALASLALAQDCVIGIEFVDRSAELRWQTSAGAEDSMRLDLGERIRLRLVADAAGRLHLLVDGERLAAEIPFERSAPTPLTVSVAGCQWRLHLAQIAATDLTALP